MIRVLFFGRVADLMGRRDLDLEVKSEPLSLFGLRAQLFDAGNLKESPSVKILMSINRELTRDDRVLQSGDEVAFFSPFSGG